MFIIVVAAIPLCSLSPLPASMLTKLACGCAKRVQVPTHKDTIKRGDKPVIYYIKDYLTVHHDTSILRHSFPKLLAVGTARSSSPAINPLLDLLFHTLGVSLVLTRSILIKHKKKTNLIPLGVQTTVICCGTSSL
ncbi:hypothetical protein JTE90_027439 [Oedothorax gibbosus]|uniref:Secreted protein n=1 Tax=Oedothorax gibbosus TaxID=931172 RepID=A0AAV6W1A9_9ARAC|nr:hypothetical protein JTE90_027439 [Oedothorax gibbosus]